MRRERSRRYRLYDIGHFRRKEYIKTISFKFVFKFILEYFGAKLQSYKINVNRHRIRGSLNVSRRVFTFRPFLIIKVDVNFLHRKDLTLDLSKETETHIVIFFFFRLFFLLFLFGSSSSWGS